MQQELEVQNTKMEEPIQGQETEPEETIEEPVYAIHPLWYEGQGISFAHVVRQRRCLDCRDAGYAPPKGTGRRKSKSKADATLSWESELDAIQRDCSLKAGYITPQTPLLEAAFRFLMESGNKPLSVPEIAEGVKGRWTGPAYLRGLDVAVLRRLLELQGAYGIRPGAAPESALVTNT